MRADTSDRLSTPASGNSAVYKAAIAVLVIAIIAGYFFYPDRQVEPETDTLPTPGPALETVKPAPTIPAQVPDIPEPAPTPMPTRQPERAAPPPITLETSDLELRQLFSEAGPATLLSNALQQEHLVERTAGLVDSVARGQFQHKLTSLPPPKAKFPALSKDGMVYMDPSGYHRFDPYTEALSELDMETLAAGFSRFRPLLEESYAALGGKRDEFDNALIWALDIVLDTPDVAGPIAIEKTVSTYRYVDPNLESLPAIQRQLLRMGPDNIRIVKRQARALRQALLATPETR